MPVERTSGGTSLIDALDRLKLAEALLGTDDLATCAQRALDWLGRSAGVTRGLCLVGSPDTPTVLEPIATLGVRGPRVQSFTLDLEAQDDPLVAASIGLGASVLGQNGRPAPRTPLESGRFIAAPLHARQTLEEYPVGLLLVAPSDPDVEAEAKWVADLLSELPSPAPVAPREGRGFVSIPRNAPALRRATQEIEENYRKLRLAEADARAERDRLDLIIDSVADPILVTDPNANIVMMNAPAERLFTADPAAGAEARRTVQANDAHFSSFVSNLFFEPGAMRRSGSIGLVDPRTGAPLPVEAISGKIVSEHGEVTAIVTILHDRTEELERDRLYEQLQRRSSALEPKIREATAELTRQNELLRRSHFEIEQASAAKSQFLANMSHEFRTPLNAILGYTSMLLKGVTGEMSPHQRRNLERVDSNAHHLLAIINDILDISRIEAGKMPLTITAFAVREL